MHERLPDGEPETLADWLDTDYMDFVMECVPLTWNIGVCKCGLGKVLGDLHAITSAQCGECGEPVKLTPCVRVR